MNPTAAPDATAWLHQGATLRQQGHTEQALSCYEQALSLPDAPPAAWFNAGNALFDLGRWAAARQRFESCLALPAPLPAELAEAAHLQAARCAAKQGELSAARAHFAAVLRLNPQQFSAWLEAGHVCRTQGATEQMIGAYQHATAAAPQRWEGHLALARGLEDLARWDEAAASYHRALLCTDTAADGPRLRLRQHHQMARWRLERGDAARALEALRAALACLPPPRPDDAAPALGLNEWAELHIDLGEILIRLGLTDEAHRALEHASQATAETTLARLAELAFRSNLWQEAQAVLRRNVSLHPDSATAHWNLAHALAESWQMEDALAELAHAEALAPMPGARSMRASIAGRMGDAATALQLYRELAAEEGPRSKMVSSAAMSTLYCDHLHPAEVAELHRTWFAPLGEGSRSPATFTNPRQPERRLRLGLVTADFHHQHPVNIFMQPVLRRLDRQQFECVVYFVGVSYDEQTHLAKQRVDRWVECTTWSDALLAQRIEADGIDVLLDLAGHTSHQRMALFARRAAPVQATFLGYPGSTGVPNMDWIVADAVVAPPEHAPLYSERIARLPHAVFCFAPEADYPFPPLPDAHATRPLTFGSFNNVPKLTPHTLGLWAQVLHAVPGSRLLLKAPSFKDPGAVRRFSEAFQRLGIAPQRLLFRGPTGLADMMAEYADVDIALDPTPYNGGTTTLQALWMGTPVLTRCGQTFVSRMGASFMQAAGLPDWVAHSDADYVAIAQRMAADRPGLLALRRSLRQRLLARPAWDIDRYTADFGALLRHIWRVACDS